MQKTWLWIGGGLIVVFLAVLFFGPRLAEQKVRAALEKVADSPGDSLTYGRLNVSLWQRSVDLDSIYLHLPIPGIAGDSLRARGRIARVSLSSIGLWPLITSGDLRAGLLRVTQPDLSFYYADSVRDSTQKDSTGSRTVFIAEYQIEDASLLYRDRSGASKVSAFQADMAAYLSRPDSSTLVDSFYLQIDSLVAPSERADYVFNDLHIPGSGKTVRLARLTAQPHQSQSAYDQNPQSKSWLAMRFDSITLEDTNIREVLRGAALRVPQLRIGHLDIRAYENKNHQSNGSGERKLLPGPRLKAIGFPFRVDTLALGSGYIKYGIMTTTGELGEIDFHNARGWIQNITNIDTVLARQPQMPVRVRARFMNQAQMEARFAFNLASSLGAFTMQGELSGYSLPDINPMLVPAANVKVERGQLRSLSYQADANQNVTKGQMELRYDDLKIDLAKGHPWYAYLFKGVVLKKENPHKGEFRPGKIYHEHDQTKSFFNLYWNALVSGMKSTVLGDVALPDPLK